LVSFGSNTANHYIQADERTEMKKKGIQALVASSDFSAITENKST